MSKVKARPMKGSENRLTDLEKTILYYRMFPVRAAEDLLGVKLTWYQRITLKKIWFVQRVLLVWGRGVAKTHMIALCSILKAMLYPRERVVALGPGLRQGDFIFDEIENFFNQSSFFRSSLSKKISRSTNRNIVRFNNGSTIISVPIGDGRKIRGLRANTLFIDEYAQCDESIIKMVIRPFLAVKKKNRQNRVILASSAFWRWNHLWRQFVFYSIRSQTDPDKYWVSNYTYNDMLLDPDSPIEPDMDEIEEARETMTSDEFSMEYESCFPEEGSTFFTSKLVEHDCTPREPARVPVEIEVKGNPKYKYVMGVDIGRVEGGSNFSISILKLKGNGVSQLVKVITCNGEDYPQQIGLIRNCTKNFNIIRIHMDKGGGGLTLKDLLKEPYFDPEENAMFDPILDMEDKETENVKGLRYLRLINFQGSKHSDLFTTLKSEMEHYRVEFPIDLRRDPDKSLEKVGQEIIATKKELMVIESEPRGNNLRFSVPARFRMDRAVSLALGIDAALDKKEPNWEQKEKKKIQNFGVWN